MVASGELKLMDAIKEVHTEHAEGVDKNIRRKFTKIDDINLRMDLIRADIDANFETQQKINELISTQMNNIQFMAEKAV